jgi:putative FmdB family regulatory protein
MVPTYDYLCENGHRFEAFQSMKDEPFKTCVECGAGVKRLIGPGAGFLFRGDGFYITDYRSKTYQDKAKAEAGGSGKSEGKAEKSEGSKSESGKPATDKAGASEKSKSEKPRAEKSGEKSSEKSSGNQADKSSAKKPRGSDT